LDDSGSIVNPRKFMGICADSGTFAAINLIYFRCRLRRQFSLIVELFPIQNGRWGEDVQKGSMQNPYYGCGLLQAKDKAGGQRLPMLKAKKQPQAGAKTLSSLLYKLTAAPHSV
jgi:hypothetical protein